MLLAGLAAGSAHVLTGPDHLAAILPLAADGRRGGAWRAGLRWGLGHVGGVVIVGALALLLRQALPLEGLSAWSERLVGAVLIGIGLWALRRAIQLRIHAHEHSHDGGPHVHVHVHDAAGSDHDHRHAALAVGALHGMAGSGHLLGVLPALALPPTEAGVYLGAFGAGTLVAMAAFSGLMGWLAGRLARRALALYPALLGASGIAAVVVGILWLGHPPA